MLITCPNCATNFSIPDAALGADGRKLKCAKCGHKWFQAPLVAPEPDEDVFVLDTPAPRPAPRPAPPPPAESLRADPLERFDFDIPPVPRFGSRMEPERPAFDPGAALLDEQPQPIPEVFATHSDSGGRRASTWALWLLLVVLLLGGLGGSAFYFQDRVVEIVPEFGDLLAQAGLRTEKPGAGLDLRKAGTPERLVLNDVEVLVVRGVIANISDRTRAVPPMKLVLTDKARQPVQEKLTRAPVAELAPQGTASFKIVLERPDPNAVEVMVVFVDPTDAPTLAPARARPPVAPEGAAPAAAAAPDAAPASPAPAPAAEPAPAPAPAAKAP